MTASRRRMAAAAAFALAVHGLALWALRHAMAPIAPPANALAPPLQAVLIIAAPARQPDASPPAATRSAAAPKPRGRMRGTPVPAAPLTGTDEAMPIDAAPPQPPAPTGIAAGAAAQLLDSAASQRAIREAAASRMAPLSARTPSGSPWENAIQNAAHGDCMRGEFAGSDMGLLSLPMLAAAMAQGKCRR